MPPPAIVQHEARHAPRAAGGFLTVEEVAARPRSRMRGHGHAGAHVCVVLEGGFDETGPKRTVRRCEPGSVRISPPGRRHQIEFGADGARCLLLIMSPRWPRTGALFPEPRTPDRFLRDEALGRLAARVSKAAGEPAADAPLRAEGLVAELIAGATRPEGPPEWLHRARSMLERQYRNPLKLAELAEEVGVHRVHLARAFARHFGTPAQSYLRSLRLAAAARRLDETQAPIAQIALEAGFFDQSHLSRAFRECFGVPPAAFRRRRQRGHSLPSSRQCE